MSTKALFIPLIALLIPLMAAECFADATADLKQAETYQKARNYKEAETIYKKIVTDYPETEYAFQAQKDLAILYINTNKDSQAQTAFQELVASFPQHPAMAEALYYIAKNFNWKNKHDKAHQIHQYNADNFSDDKYALWSQVEIIYHYIDAGDETAAQAASYRLLTAFSKQPTLPAEVYNVAQKWQGAGDYTESARLYQYVIERWPQDKKVLSAQAGLAISYELAGDKNAAKAAYERLFADLTQHEVTAEDIYWIAKTFNWAKQSNRAAGVHRYNVERFPGKEHALWSQVEVIFHHIRSGDESASDTEVDRFLSIFAGHPALPRDVYNVAKEYDKAGRHRRAGELYQHVLDNRPIDEDIYARMLASMAYMGLGDDANAQAELDKLIDDYNDVPTLPQAVFRMAEEYFRRENHQRAIELWELILSEYSERYDTSEIPFLLGTCYEATDNWQTAVQYYKQVVEEYPNTRHAYLVPHRIGLLYRFAGEYEDALYWFGQQRKLYSDHLQAQRALFEQGAVYRLDLKDYEKAAEVFQQYISEYPDDEHTCVSYYSLAKCYESIGNKARARAIAVLQEALERFSDPGWPEIITQELQQLQEGGQQ
ncbi:MAG: tetratricopeptide repeat protein [Planctomycetes bacterium]|nr:tetratricopeptide repeat protein [Planctomycetota bacterium]